ncbi:hypothetical protein [Thermococcus nautili]|uniref:Uncharacterized protein n=1 Tax=Thermococcus nautili TaxID=195522 RepID=W8NYY9_9EURY|nr:hypothetical protein [Thermococcus nautili]AHL21661.1 hypothetical protein BD01_0028 [Thermococcus nautili]
MRVGELHGYPISVEVFLRDGELTMMPSVYTHERGWMKFGEAPGTALLEWLLLLPVGHHEGSYVPPVPLRWKFRTARDYVCIAGACMGWDKLLKESLTMAYRFLRDYAGKINRLLLKSGHRPIDYRELGNAYRMAREVYRKRYGEPWFLLRPKFRGRVLEFWIDFSTHDSCDLEYAWGELRVTGIPLGSWHIDVQEGACVDFYGFVQELLDVACSIVRGHRELHVYNLEDALDENLPVREDSLIIRTSLFFQFLDFYFEVPRERNVVRIHLVNNMGDWFPRAKTVEVPLSDFIRDVIELGRWYFENFEVFWKVEETISKSTKVDYYTTLMNVYLSTLGTMKKRRGKERVPGPLTKRYRAWTIWCRDDELPVEVGGRTFKLRELTSEPFKLVDEIKAELTKIYGRYRNPFLERGDTFEIRLKASLKDLPGSELVLTLERYHKGTYQLVKIRVL